MDRAENQFNERIVKIVETCDGKVERTFYCIRDLNLGYWTSNEPFDGLIWTRDPQCRREFNSRPKAKSEWKNFLRWRREQEEPRNQVDEILMACKRARAKVA